MKIEIVGKTQEVNKLLGIDAHEIVRTRKLPIIEINECQLTATNIHTGIHGRSGEITRIDLVSVDTA